jgi:hypothetical protein
MCVGAPMSAPGVGHNGGPSFDGVVRENLERGFLLAIKEVIVQAIRDPRLERRHLRVLAEVIEFLNSGTMTAYPGRKRLTERANAYVVENAWPRPYTEPGIAKTISDLIAFGYLVSTKRQAEEGGRALSHYTIRKPTVEELQDEITAFISLQRGVPKTPFIKPKTKAVGDHVGNVTCDDTPVGNVTPVGIVRRADGDHVGIVRGSDDDHAGNDTYVGNVTSDDDHVVPTVTSLKKLDTTLLTREPIEAASKPFLVDPKQLMDRLVEAGGNGLANFAAAAGLLHVGVPMMWLDGGADLERDIIPTIQAKCMERVAKRQRPIASWAFFTAAVSDAKQMREAGLPTQLQTARNDPTAVSGESPFDRTARLVAKAMESEGAPSWKR